MPQKTYRLFAGIPNTNFALYHQIRFGVGDPAALIIANENGTTNRHLIIRDIEMERARQRAKVDSVACPADYEPAGGLSGDRETATAQSLAEYLKREGATSVTVDRTFPFYFTHEIRSADIELHYDPDLGVLDRRQKDEQEIEHLQQAQRDTEQVVQMICETIARATPAADGVLHHDDAPLTSERVFTMIDVALLERGYGNPHGAIVAGGSEGGDCHNAGRGPLRVNEPVIVDIFPHNKKTKYVGDCTRVVVNGTPTDEFKKMHAAVVAAKAAAIAATRAGTTGDAVFQETIRVIRDHGYEYGMPPADAPADYVSMPHGTGHGLGLEVHEPPLVADKGPELLVGDAVTIEPGLYSHKYGGVRIEDMVIVTENGCRNLNTIPEGWDWR